MTSAAESTCEGMRATSPRSVSKRRTTARLHSRRQRWPATALHAPSSGGKGANVVDAAEAITRDVAAILHYGDESVSVAMEEVAAADWADEVYRPDIVERAPTIYKKPGYTM